MNRNPLLNNGLIMILIALEQIPKSVIKVNGRGSSGYNFDLDENQKKITKAVIDKVEFIRDSLKEEIAEKRKEVLELKETQQEFQREKKELKKTKNLLTPKEAAEFLSIAPATLYRLDIPKIRFGGVTRYEKKDLQDFLESKKS